MELEHGDTSRIKVLSLDISNEVGTREQGVELEGKVAARMCSVKHGFVGFGGLKSGENALRLRKSRCVQLPVRDY